MTSKIGNRATSLFAVAAGALAILTLTFGATGYSLHGYQDAMGTLPPAISLAIGHGFKDQVTDLRSSWGDPTGQERYLWFPPLFSLVIYAFISPSFPLPLPQQALLIAGILGAIALLLASFVFYRVATLHGKKFDWYGAALIVAALVVILRTLWGVMARPEPLESIFLLTGFVLALSLQEPKKLIIGFAVLLGLMAAAHPFGTLFLLFCAGLVFSFRYAWRRAFSYLALICGAGLVVFVVVMQVSPYGIVETVLGIYRHSSHEVARLDIRSAVGFFKSPYAILYGFLTAFMAAVCFRFYRRYRNMIRSPFIFIASAALIAGLILYSVVLGVKTYYALLFSFFILALLVYYMVHLTSARPLRAATLIFIALFVALSLKPVLAFPAYLQRGVTIAEARQQFAPLAARYPKADIFVSADMWVVSEEYARMHYVADITPEEKLQRPFIVLLDQNHSYNSWNPAPAPPADAEGCPLKEDHFVAAAPKFLGVTLSSAMPGYGFAAYVCE